MKRINIYLFNLTNKYLFVTFTIISFFIIFINVLELSRIIQEDNKNLSSYLYLSILKYPSILNEIIPFVTIVSVAFLIRNLISNNEFVSMRNLGYSIFDIFLPISISIFLMGMLFLLFVNPLSVYMETKYDIELDNEDNSLYSIKITDNEMWIKNTTDELNSSFINIKNINLKNMHAEKIKILIIGNETNKIILAEDGKFKNNSFSLNNVKHYNFKNDDFKKMENLNFIVNFNKDNLIRSISKYKLVPFYKYLNHVKTLYKFNLYSPEIGLYYLTQILKPIFIVALSFVIFGFTCKFQRNENLFKVLFVSISIGFIIFLLKEIMVKLTITLSINFFVSYLIILLIPFFIGLYQVVKIENE